VIAVACGAPSAGFSYGGSVNGVDVIASHEAIAKTEPACGWLGRRTDSWREPGVFLIAWKRGTPPKMANVDLRLAFLG